MRELSSLTKNGTTIDDDGRLQRFAVAWQAVFGVLRQTLGEGYEEGVNVGGSEGCYVRIFDDLDNTCLGDNMYVGVAVTNAPKERELAEVLLCL